MNHVSIDQWLSLMEHDYLRDFIGQGGAGVRFVVPIERELHNRAVKELIAMGKRQDFLVASVTAQSTRLHMIDQMFGDIARQVDWQGLTRTFLRKVFVEEGYRVPAADTEIRLADIAAMNGQEVRFLRIEAKRWFNDLIFRDFRMTQEFRLAQREFCLAQLEGNNSDPRVISLLEWLNGNPKQLAALRESFIYKPISRHNARRMLFSLAHWCRLASMSGLVVVLDISNYLLKPERGERDESDRRYGMPAVLDMYELLREFIDATDDVEGLFVAVVAPKSFLDDSRRGLESYDALRMRIADEIRDKNRANPFAPMLRLSK